VEKFLAEKEAEKQKQPAMLLRPSSNSQKGHGGTREGHTNARAGYHYEG